MTSVPVGLLTFGRSAERHAHWFLPNLSVCIFVMGNAAAQQSNMTYVIDVYQGHAASALASCMILRSFLGFVLPVIAPYMHAALGYGWAGTVLAVISSTLGFAMAAILWMYGTRLRRKLPESR